MAQARDGLAHVGIEIGERLDREGGAIPVAAWSSARNPSSVIFCIPQSEW